MHTAAPLAALGDSFLGLLNRTQGNKAVKSSKGSQRSAKVRLPTVVLEQPLHKGPLLLHVPYLKETVST